MVNVQFKILKYFSPEYLPDELSYYRFIAFQIVKKHNRCEGDIVETTVALRKLLESKDAAIRSLIKND